MNNSGSISREMLLEVLEPEQWYMVTEAAALLGIPTKNLHRQIKRLEQEEIIKTRDYNNRKMIQLRPERSVAGPAYLAPLKPLTGYDPGQLMRMCEGSRKPETGMT